MFGKNEVVGQRFFRDKPDNLLFVTSIFYTLQGEGVYSGKPAVFVRLAKCNLRCSWCDTFFDDGDWLTFDETSNKIDKVIEDFYLEKKLVRPKFTKHDENTKNELVLVVTGGEPTLQKNLGPFLDHMSNIFKYTQIE